MDSLLRDTRFGLRLLRRDKGFTVTALATLSLCIGANVAIFSVVHAVVLRPLPFPESDRIMSVFNAYPNAGVQRGSNGVPDYYDRLRDVAAFEEQALFNTQRVTVGDRGAVEQVQAMNVTPSFFRLLGVRPQLGRIFSEDDAEPGNERRAILSHAFWQQHYGGRRSVIGESLRVYGNPYTIVGVMPPEFTFLDPHNRLWRPLAFTPEQKADTERHNNNYEMIGRLKPGATEQQAQAQIDALNAANLERFPEFKEILVNAGFHTGVVPLQDDVISDVKSTLVMLWGGALFVLLIGTVNIANIVLARSSRRTRELATRFALGAARLQVARQLLTETVLLTACSAALGLLLGNWGLKVLSAIGLDRVPRAGEVGLDGTVVVFTLCLAAIAAVAIGLMPAVQALHVNLSSVFRQDGRAGTGRTARLTRTTLAIVQVAIALVLLVAAGLLLKSFRQVLAIDPGFRTPERILTASVTLPAVRYGTDGDLRAFADRALENIRALPGVKAAGATDTIPFGNRYSDSVIMAEGYEMQPGESLVSPSRIVMTPGYCEAMGITLLQGRLFDSRDTESSQRVVIVDDRLAAKFWPDSSPVGRRMWRSGTPGQLLHPDERTRWYTVVGVVRSVKQRALVDRDERVGAYFFPYAQAPRSMITFAVRTSTGPSTLVPAMRSLITKLDLELPLFDVETMQERAEHSLATHRSPMLLSVIFGLVALFLAAVGIYGVLAYMVAQRTREIGIRMAVGSTPGTIFQMILKEGALILAAGLALGLTGAVLFGRTLRSLLYGVSPFDPAVMTPAAVLLGIVTIAACVLPSLRATRVDPVQALRQE